MKKIKLIAAALVASCTFGYAMGNTTNAMRANQKYVSASRDTIPTTNPTPHPTPMPNPTPNPSPNPSPSPAPTPNPSPIPNPPTPTPAPPVR